MGFFFLIMQIMHSEPNYAIFHLCIIPEALFLFLFLEVILL